MNRVRACFALWQSRSDRARSRGALLRDQRGQALVEYSTITFMLLLGTVASATFIRWPGLNVTLAQAVYAAVQVYVDGFYYSLHLMAP